MREIARSAARWMVLLESGAAGEQDHARLSHWRAADAEHERAWQKAEALRTRFQELPPQVAMASLDRPRTSRRQVLLGMAVLVPAAWLVGRQLPLEAWRADLHTATGERQSLALAEGGRLLLNTDSAVNLDATRRQVRLIRGEMALKVGGAAPFRVDTAFGHVQVGAGEVCLRQFGARCDVAVASGSATVTPLQGAPLQLTAGQRVTLGATGVGHVLTWDATEPDWRQGVLTAHNQPLGEFLTELDRYRPGVLRWDPALERLRISGSFQVADTDRILALLASSLPLAVHSRTRYWVTLVPRQAV